MIRALAVSAFVSLSLLPGGLQARQSSPAQTSSSAYPMSEGEFAQFLKRVDADTVRWEAQLRSVKVKSVRLDPETRESVEKSYNVCVQSLKDSRNDIRKLSRKQSLTDDSQLLFHLNDLAVALDKLDRDLGNRNRVALTSLADHDGSSPDTLDMAIALNSDLITFRRHVLAFAAIEVGASSNQQDDGADLK